MKRWRSMVAMLATFLVAGCVGTDVGNPQDEPEQKAEVELRFAGYQETERGALELAGGAQVDSAWIGLGQFRFRRATRCEEDGALDVAEPIAVDLLADQPSYDPPMFTKPAGDYCQLDLGFAHIGAQTLPSNAPEALVDNSMVVEGQRSDGVRFKVHSRLDKQFYLQRALSNFTLEEGQQTLIVGFALNRWINTRKLNAIEGEDPILIDEDHHPDLLAEFQDAVQGSADLYEDANRNGRLDGDEQRDSMAQGGQSSANGDENATDGGRGDAAGEGQDQIPDVGL